MNAFLVATLVLGAAAKVDEQALRTSAEFILIEHAMNDIADRISKITLKEDVFSFGVTDFIDNDKAQEDEALPTSMLQESSIDRHSTYKKATQKRGCKVFEDTRFFTRSKDKVAMVSGNTWEDCLKSCEENSLCAQVIFDKSMKECKGFQMANNNTAAGYAPEKFMSGHCKTEHQVIETTSMVQTEEKSQIASMLGLGATQMEQIKAFEEQMHTVEEKLTPKQVTEELKVADAVKEVKEDAMTSKKSSLKVQKIKKCTTFETENVKRMGSLLEHGKVKKLVFQETTGDFLTCLQTCQNDETCKQVVYDKQESQCFRHDEVVAKKTDAKGTKYIAATCQ